MVPFRDSDNLIASPSLASWLFILIIFYNYIFYVVDRQFKERCLPKAFIFELSIRLISLNLSGELHFEKAALRLAIMF